MLYNEKDEILELKSVLKKSKYTEEKVELANRTFAYFLLPQSTEPNFQDFILRCSGKKSDGYVICVSDSIKPEDRPFYVFHEIVRCLEIGLDAPDKTVKALEEELRHVPKIDLEYLIGREKYFQNQLNYFSNLSLLDNTDILDLNNAIQMVKMMKSDYR